MLCGLFVRSIAVPAFAVLSIVSIVPCCMIDLKKNVSKMIIPLSGRTYTPSVCDVEKY